MLWTQIPSSLETLCADRVSARNTHPQPVCGSARCPTSRAFAPRRTTIGEKDRADRSIKDHMAIIEALEARDTKRAEQLVRDHALGLADHVAKFADYLD